MQPFVGKLALKHPVDGTLKVATTGCEQVTGLKINDVN